MLIHLAVGCGILLLSFLIYAPALNGAFLWDDPAHVTRAELRGWDGLWRIWFEPGSTQQYYPVLHFAFWIQHRLWGDAPVAYHIVNVLLHAANACLIAAVLLQLARTRAAGERNASPKSAGSARGLASLSAFLFVAHPVCVESVAWITEQKNTLSTAFYLCAALAYLRFFRQRSGFIYGVATGLYLLALGTKTTTATLPAALLVVLWWIHGRLEFRRDVLPLLPWLVLAIPAGLVTASVERTMIGADLVVPDLTFVERTLLAARVLWFYVGKLLWPADLTFFYPLWDVSAEASGWVGYLIAACAVTMAAWLLRHRTRAPLAVWLLYVGTLFPALGYFKVFPFQFSYVADHFQYLAIPVAATGMAALLISLTSRILAQVGWRAVMSAGAVLLIGALAMKSRAESRLYVSDEVLFQANITDNPTSWMGHHILAQRIGKTPARRDEAIALFRKALELNPKSADTRGALGALLVREPGHAEEAIALFEEAIRIRPSYAEAHNALANELAALPGRLPEAVEHYQTALRLRPDFALAEANLAMALAQIPGRESEALGHFEQALKKLPDYASAHFYLARLLSRSPERLGDAATHYEQVLKLRPGARDAFYELAGVFLQLGRLADAARRADELLRFYPADVEALNLRGVIALQQGRADQARAFWLRALELAPDFEAARRNLRQLE